MRTKEEHQAAKVEHSNVLAQAKLAHSQELKDKMLKIQQGHQVELTQLKL